MITTMLPSEKQKLERPAKLLDISEIRPFLYLSGYGCLTEAKMAQLGITHAVDCTNLGLSRRFNGIEYLEIRPIISPNNGFWQQMIDFERSLRGEVTVNLIRGRMARALPDVYLNSSASSKA